MHAASGAAERLLNPARPRTATSDSVDSAMPSSSRKMKKLDRKLRTITSSWRDMSLSWQQQHAPQTSYERLVRASISEMRPEERNAIRRDVQRSQPVFTAAPWASEEVDQAAHSARLERVLCAWTQYDQEIGYVQAMNLVSSTLLLLLDGDEEASFWSLVQLIRQLPPSFYARAPLPLLGFWTEVEVLSQLASKLFGLDGLRTSLLQAAPQWMLSFWVGTLPLETIVMVWDAMLKRHSSATTPSVLPLQLGLVLLKGVQPQLEGLLAKARLAEEAYERLERASPTPSDAEGSDGPAARRGHRRSLSAGGAGAASAGGEAAPQSHSHAQLQAQAQAQAQAAHHQAFTLLQSIQVPDASAGWLLHHARQLSLNDAAVQDMRLQLRMAMEARCTSTGGVLPCTEALPECGTKPIPLLQPDRAGPRAGALGLPERMCCSVRSLANLLACGLSLISFVGSVVVWSAAQHQGPAGADWEVTQLDTLVILGLCALGAAIGWRWPRAQPAVALGSLVVALFLAARATEALLDCAESSSKECSWRPLWPVACFGLTLLVAVLQVASACAAHRGRASALRHRRIVVGIAPGSHSQRDSIQ